MIKRELNNFAQVNAYEFKKDTRISNNQILER